LLISGAVAIAATPACAIPASTKISAETLRVQGSSDLSAKQQVVKQIAHNAADSSEQARSDRPTKKWTLPTLHLQPATNNAKQSAHKDAPLEPQLPKSPEHDLLLLEGVSR
jgi:hypothetical protein